MALEQKLNRQGKTRKKLLSLLKKYRYPLLIAALGAVLLLIPTAEKQAASAPVEISLPQSEQDADTERRLEEILRCVSGAGSVRVMLTRKDEGETSYQSDRETTHTADTTNTRTQTVFCSDGSYRQTPLVTKVTAPEYLGALIVCTGGDDPAVRLQLVKAVCSLTGLGSDRVTVLKMEGL